MHCIRVKNEQYPGFARAHAPYYWLDSTQLNFRDRTRPGAVYVIWPFMTESTKYTNTLHWSHIITHFSRTKIIGLTKTSLIDYWATYASLSQRIISYILSISCFSKGHSHWKNFTWRLFLDKMMRFCKECNNLLYPRENRDKRKLEYACKAPCTYIDRNVTGSCVFMNELVKDSS